jgi:AcrR family transcriptional regulator
VPRDTWLNLPEAKRRRVLEAAMAEFGRRGFSAGSLNVVARDAGIAKGSLFQYFDDKLDFFTVTVTDASLRIRDAVLRDGDDPSMTFFGLLYRITERWLEYFRSHPLERGVALAAAFEMDPDARAAVRSVANAHYVEAFSPLIARAVERDELVDGVEAPEVVAMTVLLLRHLDSAPFVSGLDPVLGLYDRPDAEVLTIAWRMVAALERAYARLPTGPDKNGLTIGAAAGPMGQIGG